VSTSRSTMFRSPSNAARYSEFSGATAGRQPRWNASKGCGRPMAELFPVLGVDVQRNADEIRSRVGVQLQQSQLPEKMRVDEAMALFASFYPNPADGERLLEDLGLAEKRRTPYKKLSGGQQQRLRSPLPDWQPGDRVPGRADHRPGPAGAAGHLAPRRGHACPRRHGRARHALHGGGRAAGATGSRWSTPAAWWPSTHPPGWCPVWTVAGSGSVPAVGPVRRPGGDRPARRHRGSRTPRARSW